MRTTMIAILYTLLFLGTACSGKAGCNTPERAHAIVDSLWQKDFNSAQEIIENFTHVKGLLSKKDSHGNTENMCQYIWHCGEYIFRCRGKNEDIYTLPQYVEEISLDNGTVKSFMTGRDVARFVDHLYTLKFMKEGNSFEESRDGITITVFYRPRSMNGNDYRKLREVFQSHNDALHAAYLKKLRFPIGNSGCNEELYAVRPLIEQNVKDCELKSEIIGLLDEYKYTMPGEKAPAPPLKDADGKEYTFAQFHGKIIVIDVWATWCSSCLSKMPDFIALSDNYKERDDIVFLTISIDRKEAREAWLAAIERRRMGRLLNLTPDCELQSQFESDYHVSGIPRYIVIDKNGNIVTAYAPPPGDGLDEIITKAYDR